MFWLNYCKQQVDKASPSVSDPTAHSPHGDANTTKWDFHVLKRVKLPLDIPVLFFLIKYTI